MPELYIVTFISTLGVLISAYLVYRSKSRESDIARFANDNAVKISANTTMITGFSVLFETMRKQIDGAQVQIDGLHTQIEKLQTRYSIESEAWRVERDVLERRVEALELENATLRGTLKELQNQNIALKATLEQIHRPSVGATA